MSDEGSIPRPGRGTTVFLVRHGHVHNPERILYGRLPRFPLSARGRDEALRAARLLAAFPLHAAYASPRLRARQTARAIAALHPGLAVRVSRLIDEVYTRFEGEPLEIVAARREDFYTGENPPYEQPQDIVRRMVRFLELVRRRHAGGAVAAVTHGDVIAFTLLWAMGEELRPQSKARLRLPGSSGYPATGSVVRLVLPAAGCARPSEIDFLGGRP
ncbi:MAG: histidine phosphatase family protein [Desulfobacterales bacterium]